MIYSPESITTKYECVLDGTTWTLANISFKDMFFATAAATAKALDINTVTSCIVDNVDIQEEVEDAIRVQGASTSVIFSNYPKRHLNGYPFLVDNATPSTRVIFDDHTITAAGEVNLATGTGIPSVKGRSLFATAAGTTITNFTEGTEGQVIVLRASDTRIITDNDTITLESAVNFTMEAGDTLTLIRKAASNEWEEISRVIASPFGITKTVTVELDTADIIALNGTPIELVAAQGADTLIEFVGAVFVLDFSGGALAEPSEPDDLAIEYDNGSGTQIVTFDSTAFIEAAADFTEVVGSQSMAGVAAATNVNKNIALINIGNDYTVGSSTSTMTVKITYRVHELGL